MLRLSSNVLKLSNTFNKHSSSLLYRCAGSHAHVAEPMYPKIGKREIVGFGANGEPSYFDHYDLPAPAVRWAEDTPEVAKLREKAKGDWGNLTIDEKKQCKLIFTFFIFNKSTQFQLIFY
jgi:hypothetical protein